MSKASRLRRKRLRKRIVQAEANGLLVNQRRRRAKKDRIRAKKEIAREIVCPDASYVVLQTYPQQEDRVARRLAQMGKPVHVPAETREVLRKGKAVDLKRQVMPRAVFAGLERGEDPFAYREAPGSGVQGVHSPLVVAGRVARIGTRDLQRFVDRVRDKQIQEASAGPQSGQIVYIRKGPYASFRAVVDGTTKTGTIMAYVEIFGRQTLVEVAPRDLDVAA